MAHVGLLPALLQHVGEILQNHHRLGAAILQLVAQLPRRVERVDIDHHKTRPQHRSHGNRVLQDIGHHEGDAIALLQAQALQVSAKLRTEPIQLSIREVHAHEAKRRAVCVAPKAVLHQCHQ